MNKLFYGVDMYHMRKGFLIAISLLILAVVSCKTETAKSENDEFLSGNTGEVFRVVMSSTEYRAVQQSYTETMTREDDKPGDMFFMERIKRMDKINEVREGLVSVWLYPDSGRLMKIRFISSTYIEELDKLILDDIQRWTYVFKNNYVSPTSFRVKYRIVIKNRMELPDDETLKEVERFRDEKKREH